MSGQTHISFFIHAGRIPCEPLLVIGESLRASKMPKDIPSRARSVSNSDLPTLLTYQNMIHRHILQIYAPVSSLPSYLYIFMDLFATYIMDDEANFFDNFEDSLSAFFKLDLDTQDVVIKLFNDRGPHLGMYEFAKVTGIDEINKAKRVLQTLAILIYDKDNDSKEFTNTLNKSKIPQNIKSNIDNFTTKLDEVGKNGLKIRYFIDASNIDEPILTFIHHTVFLKAVEDYDGKTVCHTPIIRLKFSFDNNGEKISEYAYMSIEQLQIMIDGLRDVYQSSAKTIETYKIKQHPDFLIVGNK